MKQLALSVLVIAVTGCASQTASPPPSAAAPMRTVGQSQLAPKAAAMCIAQKWASMAGQPAQIQSVFANDTAFDVFVPGQAALSGGPSDSSLQAALVRPAASGSGSMVTFRGTASPVSDTVGQCQSG